MKFFVAIYPGDAKFHSILPTNIYEYGYLFSVAYFTPQKLSRFIEGFNGDIIIDSGSFKEINNFVPSKSQKEVLKNQIKLLKCCYKTSGIRNVILVHYDFPVNFNFPKKLNDERIEITLENAEIFKNMCLKHKNKLPPFKTLAVIQGYNKETIKYCLSRLMKIEFFKNQRK